MHGNYRLRQIKRYKRWCITRNQKATNRAENRWFYVDTHMFVRLSIPNRVLLYCLLAPTLNTTSRHLYCRRAELFETRLRIVDDRLLHQLSFYSFSTRISLSVVFIILQIEILNFHSVG